LARQYGSGTIAQRDGLRDISRALKQRSQTEKDLDLSGLLI
jgi:hypothetical protein